MKNLTCTFLKEFLLKTKAQLLPGLSQRKLSSKLDASTLLNIRKIFTQVKEQINLIRSYSMHYMVKMLILLDQERTYSPRQMHLI